ncbi:KTSC domain-containing protein [Mesorhizobium sp. B2-4-14]|uniref:KTSC domain-containing protein n=2 Tax=Mesorhizobium TaxID=68287 RepID=UPI0032B2EE69
MACGFIWLSSQVAKMPSTAIRNIQYDPATRILSVWFVPTGHRYDYMDVAAATYAAFRTSSSKGSFFNKFIRDHYRYRRVA